MKQLTPHSSANDFMFAKPEFGSVLDLRGLPGAGPIILDQSAAGNHGAVNGVTWQRNSQGLPILNFDGTSATVDCGASSSLKVTSDFTLSLWVSMTSYGTDWQVPFVSSLNWGANGLEIGVVGGAGAAGDIGKVILLNGAGSEQFTGTVQIPLVIWTYVTVTWTAASKTVACFLNGVSGGSGNLVSALSASSGHFHLGSREGAAPWFAGSLALPVVANGTSLPSAYAFQRHLFY